MADVAKAVKQSKEVVEILGLRIQRMDRFVAIVVAAVMVFTVAAAGYWYIDGYQKQTDAEVKKLRAEITSGIEDVRAEFLDEIADVAILADTTGKSLAKLRDDMNGQTDGYWLPIPLKFGNANTHVRFTLPIDPDDTVRALIFGESVEAEVMERNLIIEVNNAPLDAPAQFIAARTPQTIKAAWRDDGFQNFDVYLRADTAASAFEKIKGGNLSMLVVIKRAFLGPAVDENVPE